MGIYVANEGVEDVVVPRTVKLMADLLRDEFEATLILVVRLSFLLCCCVN